MQQSKPMQKNKTFKSESSPKKGKFTTFDDALDMVSGLEKLTDILKELGERKHPLAIRKGILLNVAHAQKSAQIKGRHCTYFLDVRQTKTGMKYLQITQSRKADGDEFERKSIFLSPEDAEKFVQKFAEMIQELK